jgi:hypothetical protein
MGIASARRGLLLFCEFASQVQWLLETSRPLSCPAVISGAYLRSHMEHSIIPFSFSLASSNSDGKVQTIHTGF